MKRWPKLLFLDAFTVLAIIVLIIHYGFDSSLPERRVTMSWVIVGLQVIVNVANWWMTSGKSPNAREITEGSE